MRRRGPQRPAPPLEPGPAEEAVGAADDLEDARDLELRDVSLANVSVLRGRLQRVAFHNCRMTGFGWPDGELQDVAFHGCTLDLANLRGATLRRVAFHDCVLREADLGGVRATDVLVAGCDLRGAELGGLRSRRLELRANRVEALQGLDGLRGALFPWSDVLDLAAPLAAAAGLVVLGEEEDEASHR